MGDDVDVKEDPILYEFKFCEECEPKVLQLIEYVRALENGQIAAKDALETMEWANQKLTKEQHLLAEERDKWKEKAEKVQQADLDRTLLDLKRKHQQAVERGRM